MLVQFMGSMCMCQHGKFCPCFSRDYQNSVLIAIVTSTPPSRPNKAGLKCLSVRPSTKSFFDFNEIWYVGEGRRVMHDGMQYDPVQGKGH